MLYSSYESTFQDNKIVIFIYNMEFIFEFLEIL